MTKPIEETKQADQPSVPNYYDIPFEERLEQELGQIALQEEQGNVRPYVIFRKTEMHNDPRGRGRVKPVEVVYVHYLDACHGDVQTITKFERYGWPVVAHGNLKAKDPEVQDRFDEVSAHLEGRKSYMGVTPRPDEAGILKKKRQREEARANG